MATQLKKGSFEICLLALLSKQDHYGYELAQELNKEIKVKESTIYLILQRLEKAGLLSSYVKVIDGTAKARKYYKLTPDGEQQLEELLREWDALEQLIQRCIKKGVDEDE